MSQILDSHMVPTKPPKRRRLTEEERRRVAHVRKMKACESCRRKHQKVQIYALYVYTIESLTAENSAITYQMPIPTRTQSPLKALGRTHQLQIRGHFRSYSRLQPFIWPLTMIFIRFVQCEVIDGRENANST